MAGSKPAKSQAQSARYGVTVKETVVWAPPPDAVMVIGVGVATGVVLMLKDAESEPAGMCTAAGCGWATCGSLLENVIVTPPVGAGEVK
jgi:hypothetical protein